MKTIADLFELILKETELNEGKLVQHQFDINTKYNYVSMYNHVDIEGRETEEVFSRIYFDTPEQLQLAYWTIYNNGRLRFHQD